MQRGESLVFKSDGFVDEAMEGFLDIVTAKLWNGSSEKIIMVGDSALLLLDPESSKQTHAWPLSDVVSATEEGSVVNLTLSRGLWWARNPQVVLPTPERAQLLCDQLARRKWSHAKPPKRRSESLRSAPDPAADADRERLTQDLARSRAESDAASAMAMEAAQRAAEIEASLQGERLALAASRDEAVRAERAAAAARAEAAEAEVMHERAAAVLARTEAAAAREAQERAEALAAEATEANAALEEEVIAAEEAAEEAAAEAAAAAAAEAVSAAEAEAEAAVAEVEEKLEKERRVSVQVRPPLIRATNPRPPLRTLSVRVDLSLCANNVRI